jgi:hypothetical protein
MREDDPGRAEPAVLSEPDVQPSELHVASPADVTAARTQDDRLDTILRRADVRDRAAEVRDRDAEGREPGAGDREAAIDRGWAGRDRDRAAEDRADLLALLRRVDPATDPASTDEPPQ